MRFLYCTEAVRSGGEMTFQGGGGGERNGAYLSISKLSISVTNNGVFYMYCIPYLLEKKKKIRLYF